MSHLGWEKYKIQCAIQRWGQIHILNEQLKFDFVFPNPTFDEDRVRVQVSFRSSSKKKLWSNKKRLRENHWSFLNNFYVPTKQYLCVLLCLNYLTYTVRLECVITFILICIEYKLFFLSLFPCSCRLIFLFLWIF
jgi:hypothetical protein